MRDFLGTLFLTIYAYAYQPGETRGPCGKRSLQICFRSSDTLKSRNLVSVTMSACESRWAKYWKFMRTNWDKPGESLEQHPALSC